jgi:hypothetical protein
VVVLRVLAIYAACAFAFFGAAILIHALGASTHAALGIALVMGLIAAYLLEKRY